MLKLHAELDFGVTLSTKLGGINILPASNATLKLPIPPLISSEAYLL